MVISVILALHARSWNLPEFQEILIVFCRWSKKKEKKNRQEDTRMVKVLPYFISSLVKIYNFLNWVHLKNWRKTFIITLWALPHLPLGNLQWLVSQRPKKGPLEVVMYYKSGFRTETIYDYYIVMKTMFLVVKLSSQPTIGYVNLTILLPWTTHKQHQNYSKTKKFFQNQNFHSHNFVFLS